MEIKLDSTARGTRIIMGDSAKRRRKIINDCISISEENGFEEIVLPSMEMASIYTDKAGQEILGQMYVFKDKGERELWLRPEGTATCQLLASERFKYDKDIKLWYDATCWRYERPQSGRYREFTQFGIEILNPTKDYFDLLVEMAEKMVKNVCSKYEVNKIAKRGLAYYLDGSGFEIAIEKKEEGEEKRMLQIVGGGRYREGIGFAVGIDRLMIV